MFSAVCFIWVERREKSKLESTETNRRIVSECEGPAENNNLVEVEFFILLLSPMSQFIW